MNILITGNCQVATMKTALSVLLPGAEIDAFHLGILGNEAAHRRIEAALPKVDIILAQKRLDNDQLGLLSEQSLAALGKPMALYPTLFFAGFHPDIVYVQQQSSGRIVQSPIGDYSSALVFYAHLNGLKTDAALRLFDPEIFEKLGYFARFEQDMRYILGHDAPDRLALAPLVAGWVSSGCFMHSMNHPKLAVTGTIAKYCLDRLGLPYPDVRVQDFTHDPFATAATWPVYPAIARRLGVDGDYRFKTHGGPAETTYFDLEAFVDGSLQRLSDTDDGTFKCDRVQNGAMAAAIGPLVERLFSHPSRTATHPYRGLPDAQFWRKAVAQVPAAELDPVGETSVRIGPDQKVATAGSCFAQHIARTLQAQGYNYFVTEPKPVHMDDAVAKAAGYGLFSARYGNIYTARQLVQLFDRAHGTFTPADDAWERPDGRLADPFRPQLEPDGFDGLNALHEARKNHFEACRRLFAECRVFIFTLGLTEAWRARADGAVFPLAPGVAAGTMDPDRYEFINFSHDDVVADLNGFMVRLRMVNPAAQVILTVSPVPLIATYEKQHVLVSTAHSKSILRSAADTAVKRWEKASYFPSYEIVTGHYNAGRYFADDLREVTAEGVAHVMRLFARHHMTEPDEGQPTAIAAREALDRAVAADRAAAAQVICDEEMLDPN